MKKLLCDFFMQNKPLDSELFVARIRPVTMTKMVFGGIHIESDKKSPIDFLFKAILEICSGSAFINGA